MVSKKLFCSAEKDGFERNGNSLKNIFPIIDFPSYQNTAGVSILKCLRSSTYNRISSSPSKLFFE